MAAEPCSVLAHAQPIRAGETAGLLPGFLPGWPPLAAIPQGEARDEEAFLVHGLDRRPMGCCHQAMWPDREPTAIRQRRRAVSARGSDVRSLAVVEYVSLDGVIQAPGHVGEDRDGGFAHGGWSSSTAEFMADHRRYNSRPKYVVSTTRCLTAGDGGLRSSGRMRPTAATGPGPRCSSASRPRCGPAVPRQPASLARPARSRSPRCRTWRRCPRDGGRNAPGCR